MKRSRAEQIPQDAALWYPVEAGETVQKLELLGEEFGAWERAVAILAGRPGGAMMISDQEMEAVRDSLGTAIMGLSMAAGAMKEAAEVIGRDQRCDASKSQ